MRAKVTKTPFPQDNAERLFEPGTLVQKKLGGSVGLVFTDWSIRRRGHKEFLPGPFVVYFDGSVSDYPPTHEHFEPFIGNVTLEAFS